MTMLVTCTYGQNYTVVKNDVNLENSIQKFEKIVKNVYYYQTFLQKHLPNGNVNFERNSTGNVEISGKTTNLAFNFDVKFTLIDYGSNEYFDSDFCIIFYKDIQKKSDFIQVTILEKEIISVKHSNISRKEYEIEIRKFLLKHFNTKGSLY